MRLKERELTEACLRRRVAKSGALGSRPEAFSDEKVFFRASLLPDGGEMKTAVRGLKSGAQIRLLAGKDLAVKPGDGVQIGDAFYIVQSVQKWIAHQEIICGAKA